LQQLAKKRVWSAAATRGNLTASDLPASQGLSRFVPIVQSPHMIHEREVTLVGQVKEPERRVDRTGHLVHFERTPGPGRHPGTLWLQPLDSYPHSINREACR